MKNWEKCTTKKLWLKRGVARHEDRKLGGSFSGLAAVGDQVNDMFAMCQQAQGWKREWWKLWWICSGHSRYNFSGSPSSNLTSDFRVKFFGAPCCSLLPLASWIECKVSWVSFPEGIELSFGFPRDSITKTRQVSAAKIKSSTRDRF